MRPQRLRKLLGTLFMVVFIVFYSLVIMTIAAAKLPDMSKIWQIVFYVVAGLAWTVPAAILIKWMQGSEQSEN